MPILFTIGYQGLAPDTFVGALTRAGVSTVADVRINPQSRKPGFSRKRLSETLEAAGMGYVWLRGLGSPDPVRDLAHAGDWPGMRKLYAAHLDEPEAQDDYTTLRGLALDEDVCLLCFEANPEECHRFVLADRLAGETGLPVTHLRGSDQGELAL
jgi:uncharacterized protein (DUF488 family)